MGQHARPATGLAAVDEVGRESRFSEETKLTIS
jgi:hypothetical protein